MSVGGGTRFAPGQHIGQPLYRRTSDGAFVHVFWSGGPFIHNGVTVSAVASWIETDGYTYVAKTAAQVEAGYTPAANNHNLTGR